MERNKKEAMPRRLPLFEDLASEARTKTKTKAADPGQAALDELGELGLGARDILDLDCEGEELEVAAAQLEIGRRRRAEVVRLAGAMGSGWSLTEEIESYGDSEGLRGEEPYSGFPYVEEHEIDHILFAHFSKYDLSRLDWSY